MYNSKIKSLYIWLIEDKGYSEFEADETIIRCDCGMYLPDEVLSDVKEYRKIFT